jgi:hypothetical protein
MAGATLGVAVLGAVFVAAHGGPDGLRLAMLLGGLVQISGAAVAWAATRAENRSGPAVRFRRSKMSKPYGRISENVLFAVLLAAVIGWTAAAIAAYQPAAASTHSWCLMLLVSAGRS